MTAKTMLVSALLMNLLAVVAESTLVAKQAEAMSENSPIQKVVDLIEEMKAETEKEAAADKAAYDKYMCWCETSEKEKTAAIADAEKRIEAGEAFIAEAKATEGELKTQIEGLEEDLSADKDALATAEEQRAKEAKEYTAAATDMKETIALLTEAVKILSKVQFLQKGQSTRGNDEATALLQVRTVVSNLRPKLSGSRFAGVLQKDLFDFLGAFKGEEEGRGRSFFLEEKQPNALEGAAAGAKSYNSRSGAIFGIMDAMKDEFTKELAQATKEETKAAALFSELKESKLAEIAAAESQKDAKEKELAELMKQVSDTDEDIAALNASLDADQKFMIKMTESCKAEDEEYASRVKVRSEEILALGQTIGILTGDNTRSLFDKTISFVQLTRSTQRVAARDHMLKRALDRMVKVAQRNGNLQLASLAVRVRLDAFTKVKEAMDKMLAELKAQQEEEYKKKELCDKEIDETEDSIKVATGAKGDLAAKHKQLSNTLATTESTITALKEEVQTLEVDLKQAGEQRKAANALYQQSIADQRATVNILHTAMDRLKAFYTPKAALVQVRQHLQEGVAPPPPKPAGYEKSATSGRLFTLLADVIKDAEITEVTLKQTEQEAQKVYADLVADTASSIEAKHEAIAVNEEKAASTKAELSETEESQLANKAELAKLDDLLKGLHLDCDYVIKYFDVRQTARAEEMDSINEAKAILSGADFA